MVHILWVVYVKLYVKEYSWLNNQAWHIGNNVACEANVFHMSQYVAQFQHLELGNPRGFWADTYENFVGWARKFAKRWGGLGTQTSQVVSVILRARALAYGY